MLVEDVANNGSIREQKMAEPTLLLFPQMSASSVTI